MVVKAKCAGAGLQVRVSLLTQSPSAHGNNRCPRPAHF